MPPRTILFLLVVIVFPTACHKDSTPPKPPVTTPADSSKTTPSAGTMNINLINTGNTQAITSYELVISEPGGMVLLDTIVHYQTTVKASLRTNATLVDVTTIDTSRTLHINLYKSVNPSSWKNMPIAYGAVYFTNPLLPTTNATVNFNHFPAGYLTDPASAGDVFYMNGTSNAIGGTGDNTQQTYSYQRHPGVYSYLGLFHLGLYKLFVPSGDQDTVDLTQMDTANTLNFTRTPSWASSYYYLKGIPDSTYRYKDIELGSPAYLGKYPKADLMYPKDPMQAYELYFYVQDPNYNVYGFYNWGKTIPVNPLMLEASYIDVTNSAADNFAVSFNGPISYYTASYGNSSKVSLQLVASPDSSGVHALSTLNNQKCKWLSGVTYSDVKLTQVWAERSTGFTYQAYIQYVADSTRVQTHQLNFSSFIIRGF